MPFHSKWLIKIVSWKFILYLATVALAVQTISLTLSWYYMQKKVKDDKHEKSSQISKDFSSLLSNINQWKLPDKSGQFSVVAGIIKSLNWHYYSSGRKEISSDFQDVNLSMITHCSLYHITLLPELAKRWKGSISVAVFLLSEEIQRGLVALLTLRYCFPEIKANVTFSLVFPINSTVSDTQFAENTELLCSSMSGSFSRSNKHNYELEGVPYPNNLLRNTARKIVYSTFITVLDIDFLPNIGLHDSFIEYVIEKNLINNGINNSISGNKTVWVLPSYEVEDSAVIPNDKSSLLLLKERGLARPFYKELCWKCQKYTNYDAWEKDLSSKSNSVYKLSHIYEVRWKDPWEPFYIARSDIPAYDERFCQYGFNRISQVCELHISGYQFLILDSAFVVHRGFKRKGSLHHSKHKEQEINRIHFRQFKNDLKKKYPESSRRCY